MSEATIKATQFGFVKRITYSSWLSRGAYQGQYSGGYPRVGVMKFGTALDVNWPNQIISEIRLILTFPNAGYNEEKTIWLYRGAKNKIEGTGESMIGAGIGSFKTNGKAYNATRTITFSASSNSSVFNGLVTWLQSMTTSTLTIYHDETTSGEYTQNYLEITAATMIVTYEPAGSSGTLDKTSVVAGESVNLTITPLENTGTLTHSVEWTMGEASSGVIQLGDALTASYSVPLDWLSQIPNAAQGTAYCKLTTYVDGVERSTRSVAFTVYAPADLAPTFDAVISPVGTTESYYQYIGAAKVEIQNAESQYGATVTSYKISGSEDESISEASLTTANFANYGTHEYSLSVTDSRGRTTSKTISVFVTAVGKPSIAAFSARRYASRIDDAGETVYADNLSGGHVWFTISASIDLAGGNNVPTAYILYNIVGSKAQQRIDIAWPEGERSLTAIDDRSILTVDIPVNAAYEFTLYVTDKSHTTSRASRVEKSYAAMHFAGNGYGISAGMFSNGSMAEPLFEVAPEYHSRFHGGVWGANPYRLDRVSKHEELAITNTNFASYGADLTPRISRVGAMVFLDGMVKNTVDIGSGMNQVIASLPEWARPAIDVNALQQGSGEAYWWLRVHTTGDIALMRYRTGEGYVAAVAGRQFPLSLCWLAADAFLQTYTISSTYTRISADNAVATASEDTAYVAHLTPDLGTEITSISILMGGEDVTAAVYTTNLIRIPIVTGNVEIVAIAEETPAALIQVSDDGNGNVTLNEVIDGSLLHENEEGAVDVTKYATAIATNDGDGNITLE